MKNKLAGKKCAARLFIWKFFMSSRTMTRLADVTAPRRQFGFENR